MFHLSADLLSGVGVGPKATESCIGGPEWLAFAGSVGRRAERTGTPVGTMGGGRGGAGAASAFRTSQFSVSLRGGASDPDGGGAHLPGMEGPEETPSDACLGLAVPEGGWDRPHTEVGPDAAGAQLAPLALPGYLQSIHADVKTTGSSPPMLLLHGDGGSDSEGGGCAVGSYAHWHVRLLCRTFSPVRNFSSIDDAADLLDRPPVLKLSRCGAWLGMVDRSSRKQAGDGVLTAWHLPLEAIRPRASPPRRDREAENKAITRAMLRLDESELGAAGGEGEGEGESKEDEVDESSSSSSEDEGGAGGLGGGGGGSFEEDEELDPVAAAKARIESRIRRAPAGLWVPAAPLVPSVIVTNRGCGRPVVLQQDYEKLQQQVVAPASGSGEGLQAAIESKQADDADATSNSASRSVELSSVASLDDTSDVFFDFATNAYCPVGIPGAYCDSPVGTGGDEDGRGGLIGAGGTAYAGSVAGGRSVGGGSSARGGSSGGSVFGGAAGSSVGGGSKGGPGSVAGSRAGSVGGASVGSTGSAY